MALKGACIVQRTTPSSIPTQVVTNPIGSGPYKFVSTIQQNQTILYVFDDYWGGRPAFQQLTFFGVVPDATTRTVDIH